jgi:selenoprotein W-related protein
LAQEILQELEQNVASLALIPGSGGMFEVRVDGRVVFHNKTAGRFPEPREIKDAVRQAAGVPAKERHG